MHKTAFAVALAFAVATLGTSSLYAATDGATEPDAITGATKKRESHSGAFRLTDTKEGQTLLREMARDFIWTGDTTFDGHKIKGGRQMFGIATSYHNVPETSRPNSRPTTTRRRAPSLSTGRPPRIPARFCALRSRARASPFPG